jgi:hypothetical protein
MTHVHCDEPELPVGDLWSRSAVEELDIPDEDLLAVGLALLAQAERDGIDLDAPEESNRKQDQKHPAVQRRTR